MNHVDPWFLRHKEEKHYYDRKINYIYVIMTENKRKDRAMTFPIRSNNEVQYHVVIHKHMLYIISCIQSLLLKT